MQTQEGHGVCCAGVVWEWGGAEPQAVGKERAVTNYKVTRRRNEAQQARIRKMGLVPDASASPLSHLSGEHFRMVCTTPNINSDLHVNNKGSSVQELG